MDNSRIILSAEVAEAKLQRLALQVAEQLTEDDAPLLLLGIHPNGFTIANKIAELLKPYIQSVEVASLKIDKEQSYEVHIETNTDFNDKNILIVDDVSNSGKTLLYALRPLLASYPKCIQVLVLVERMHKLFPIKPDYVGYSIATSYSDYIKVSVKDNEITALLISGD